MPSKEISDRRKANGKCYNCGGSVDFYGVLCQKCIDKRKVYNATKIKKYKKASKCSRCGATLDDETRISCQKCTLRRHMIPFMRYPGELNRR
jgi:NMD protein affecting ribosome stability and mRNA decay